MIFNHPVHELHNCGWKGGGGQSDCNDMIALTRANSSDRTSTATQDATHPGDNNVKHKIVIVCNVDIFRNNYNLKTIT